MLRSITSELNLEGGPEVTRKQRGRLGGELKKPMRAKSVNRLELLRDLSCAFGVSGDEKEVMDILERLLQEPFNGTRDRFGNRIFTRQGRDHAPVILLAAHADEVGFMVQSVHPKGYLALLPLGSWDPPAAIGMPVQVKSRTGLLNGIIGSVPPHHRLAEKEVKPPRWEDIWLDLGARSAEEVRESLGVFPGDRVQPFPVFHRVADGRVLMGKAWDDRVGCALLAELLLHTRETDCPNSLKGVVTVQEEVGLRGAQVLAGQLEADVLIVLEGAPADDFPGSLSWQDQGAMGKGVQIRSSDVTMLANPGLRDFLVTMAAEEKIPYQVAVRRSGGTDGGPLHRAGSGIPGIVLSVPVRYAHNGAGLIDLEDYEACLRLLVSAVSHLSHETVMGFLW